MYIAKYLPTIQNSYVQILQKKIEKKNWEHEWFPKLREISFKAEMSADGRTDWLTDSQSSLSSFYNIDWWKFIQIHQYYTMALNNFLNFDVCFA